MSSQSPGPAGPFRYEGFASPTFTAVPDDLFDVLAPELTEAELRVLLYLVRRTFGFKRERDSISLKQLTDGIRTRDGRVLDRGAGIAKSAAVRAVKGLVAKGVVEATRNQSRERGDQATTYTLRFRAPDGAIAGQSDEQPDGEREAGGVLEEDTGVSLTGTGGCPPAEHGGVLLEDPQETVKLQTGQGDSKIRKAPDVYGQHERTPTRASARRGEVLPLATLLQGEHAGLATRPTEPGGASTVVGSAAESNGQVSNRREEPACDDANGTHRAGDQFAGHRRRRPGDGDEDRRVILAYIEDFARELGDQATLASSTSRACNLYRRAGLDRAAFVDALMEARTVTKARVASIRAIATRGNWLAPTPRMAYFFAVLEDVLGLKDA